MNDGRLWGEFYLDDSGEIHFICHNRDNSAETRAVIRKLIILLQARLGEQDCHERQDNHQHAATWSGLL